MSPWRGLDEPEFQAWIGYRRMRLLLDSQVARDLAERSGLSMPDYDVLSALTLAVDQRARLNALAARMNWSKSRLSRHLSRMEQRGLVRREECTTDGRGAIVALTAKGLAAIDTAAPGHAESVRAHFIDLLTPQQRAMLAEIADAVLDHLDAVDQRSGD